jgi:hypothetical protein
LTVSSSEDEDDAAAATEDPFAYVSLNESNKRKKRNGTNNNEAKRSRKTPRKTPKQTPKKTPKKKPKKMSQAVLNPPLPAATPTRGTRAPARTLSPVPGTLKGGQSATVEHLSDTLLVPQGDEQEESQVSESVLRDVAVPPARIPRVPKTVDVPRVPVVADNPVCRTREPVLIGGGESVKSPVKLTTQRTESGIIVNFEVEEDMDLRYENAKAYFAVPHYLQAFSTDQFIL